MDRIKELEDLIKYHKAKYYQGTPEITDLDYDNLENELKNIDPKNKVLTIVGSSPSGSKKVPHDTKMLSLNKTYKIEELMSWVAEHQVVSTYKIDGVSCSIIFEDGFLTLAKTRGDGSVGEDITDKVIWMKNIPSSVKDVNRFEVRGEIYCNEESFFHLSQEMETLGLEKPMSQRNIVAGLIGRKENIELCRYIEFRAFDIIEMNLNFSLETEKIKKLKALGFLPEEMVLHKSEKDILERLEETQLFMSEGDYQIDGLVFSFNEIKLHEEMGSTSHHPRFKMAFKFQGEAKNTEILDIVWQVSRNGILTPIAEVAPVELSGAKISRVTLHNFGMVKQYGLKNGDTIQIIRSGEVIPKFMEVISSKKGEIRIPKKCPSCEGPIREDDIRLRCDNQNCPAQIKESILNFIQKIKIEDLSSKRLDELLRVGLIKEIPDLYRIKKEDLLCLDKVKDKLADKLMKAIDKSKSTDLATFLSALGIQGGAFNKCEKVVLAGFNTLEKIYSLTIEELLDIEGFAEKSANEFHKSLESKKEVIRSLEELGFEFVELSVKDSPISQKKICITGTLSRKRSDIENTIRNNGGIIVGSVSKNTDLILTNEEAGTSSKFKKAKTLGITIINEESLYNLLGD
ncbi:MAG: NAD-dependent DNA ligase LigA [Bacteriovoracaceae bacterium]|nr:NAD-dependent DNA ligase LigA [Bacteriovoracaceae bacterium]